MGVADAQETECRARNGSLLRYSEGSGSFRLLTDSGFQGIELPHRPAASHSLKNPLAGNGARPTRISDTECRRDDDRGQYEAQDTVPFAFFPRGNDNLRLP